MKTAEKKKLIAALVAAGANGMLIKQADATELAASGDVEVNTTVAPDANGMVLARIPADKLATASTPAAPKAKFEITSGIVPVDGVRGGVREEVYPFSQLEIGQSFVVAAEGTETPKDVVGRFSSTVSSATRRFSEESATTKQNRKGETVPVLVATRKFTLRPVTKGQTYPGSDFVEPVDGARVYRIAL